MEHHFLEEYSHSSAPEVFLAAAAAAHQRIRLGHGIVQIPPAVNHPARVAERIATLDLISDGRVEFGTGESASAAEMGGFLVDRTRKREMWEDAMGAIARMFVEEPFAGWDGEFWSMPPRNVVPKPLQKPHPPLWVACSRRETIQFAARNGIGALHLLLRRARGRRQVGRGVLRADRVRRVRARSGFNVNPGVAVVLPMMLHDDEATAIERGIDGAHFFGYSLAHYYGMGKHQPGAHCGVGRVPPEPRRARVRPLDRDAGRGPAGGADHAARAWARCAGRSGPPTRCCDLCRRYEAVGVDQVIFVLQAGPNRHEHICESLELFARKVMPEFDARARAARAGQVRAARPRGAAGPGAARAGARAAAART